MRFLTPLVRKIAGSVLNSYLIVTFTFFLIRLAPGNPASVTGGRRIADPQGAGDTPLSVLLNDYLAWLGAAVKGEFGQSLLIRGQPVSALFLEALPVTLTIAVPALILAVMLASGLAIKASAASPLSQKPVLISATVVLSLPSFVLAPLLSLLFGSWLQLLPVAGHEPASLRHLVLPVIALALPLTASLFAMLHASLAEVLSRPFVRTARAKGLSPSQTVSRHAWGMAVLPLISMLGPLVASTLLGTVVVETIFDLPGIGRLFLDAALGRDYPIILAATVFSALVIILANAIADMAQNALDPRASKAGAP